MLPQIQSRKGQHALMASTRRRERELVAVAFNQKEQRVLEKSLNTISLELTYSLKLLDLTNRSVKVNFRHMKDRVSRIKSHLAPDEIQQLRQLEADGKLRPMYTPVTLGSALKIAAAARRLHSSHGQKPNNARAKSALPRVSVSGQKNHFAGQGRQAPPPGALKRSNSVSGAFMDAPPPPSRGGYNNNRPESAGVTVGRSTPTPGVIASGGSRGGGGGGGQAVGNGKMSENSRQQGGKASGESRQNSGKGSSDISRQPSGSLLAVNGGGTRSAGGWSGSGSGSGARGTSPNLLHPARAAAQNNGVASTSTSSSSSSSSSLQDPYSSKRPGSSRVTISPDHPRLNGNNNNNLPKRPISHHAGLTTSGHGNTHGQHPDSTGKSARISSALSVNLTPPHTSHGGRGLGGGGGGVSPGGRGLGGGGGGASHGGRAPFSSHVATEKDAREREENLPPPGRGGEETVGGGGGLGSGTLAAPPRGSTFTGLNDDTVDDLGEDLFAERRQELLEEEHYRSGALDKRKDRFLEDIDRYLKDHPPLTSLPPPPPPPPKPSSAGGGGEGEGDGGGGGGEKLEDAELDAVDALGGALFRRQRRVEFLSAPTYLPEQDYRERLMGLWRDMNKCRYLRVPDDMIDLSGINTLAADNMKMFQVLKRRDGGEPLPSAWGE